MDEIDDLVMRDRPAMPGERRPELWPGSDIATPGRWNPDGVLGGVEDYPSYSGLELVMTPAQMADAGLVSTAGQDASDGKSAATPSPDAGQDDGLDGIRPAGWEAPSPNGGGASLTIGQVDPDRLAPGRPEGNYLGDYLPHGLRTPIGPVQGYPETGKGAWRSELDDQITTGVNDHNAKHGFKPGDPLYLTPQLAKSWIMQESGGTRSAFEHDPIQVNNPADWKNTGKDKAKILGLTEGQVMTPMTSIPAGMGWLFEKGAIHDANHAVTGYRNLFGALEAYNGNKNIDPNGLPHNVNYANSILGRVGSRNGAQGR